MGIDAAILSYKGPRANGLRVTEESLSLNSDRTTWELQWSQVRRIAAWKTDAFTVDIICMGFEVDGSESMLPCCEEDAGWDKLLDHLQERFGVNLDDWFTTVAFPAFETNYTILWERSDVKSAP